MKLQDVILKAMAKRLSWIEAAEIAGMSVRHMQRLRQRYQEFGYRGLFDQRRGKRSVHRIPIQLGQAGTAGGGADPEPRAAGAAPATSATAAATGDDAAHRWQQAPMVER